MALMTEGPRRAVQTADAWAMGLALDEARRAVQSGDVPVGAVVVGPSGEVVARGHNVREALDDPTGHAEVVALRAAADRLGRWRLDDCTLVVTLEPCLMCAGAIVLARVPRLVLGAWDPKAGACGSQWDVVRDRRLNHRVEVVGGVRADECGLLLQHFFEAQREAAAFSDGL
ncbi:tRNA adenosine(34) deaminase TadA [Cellulomonas fimi]|uniref:tRNA-specific adenosine deaminase n=1 Tax=Cellulomonas fimi (strain ATCC 484 / DSM 20113 / JCM 1341 / CCUG 24087 / LMG 16345 / NBRC 15513 / NCIMB 8980 / NCTC 7547 / NRS-133) TaxID=590998 RepID=F4H2H5_CELFA|nr:CMP/dCMP deaminase zinc-binding protein [Cellulomonas fimi ATCC 484]VEH36608.1 tRNA-specific adenosine deaminase [Cellulomonas fimi]